MYEKAMIEKKNELLTRAEEVLNKAKAETRELTEDEAAELAEIRDNIRRIMKTLDIADDIDRAKGAMEEKPDACADTETRSDEQKQADVEAEETRAFEDYLRERANNMEKGDNGAVIPTTIANRIIRKVYDICPILERAEKFTTKGNLDLPYYDEETTAITVDWADEFDELASNVGEFKSITLSGYLAGALALVSQSLINNSQFDIVNYVIEQMAYSIKRFIEGVLLNGGGSVDGLSGATNVKTAGAATEVTSDEVIELKDSIKDEFQPNACWIMSPATRTALRLLKDDVGRYLLQDDVTAPFGSTLLGKPIFVSDNMPDMAAGAKAIVYGDLKSLAVKWVEEMEIKVLREKYATMHAVGVVAWLEFDAKIQRQQGVAVMKMATG